MQIHIGTQVWVGQVQVQVSSKSPTEIPHPWPGFSRFFQAPDQQSHHIHYQPPLSPHNHRHNNTPRTQEHKQTRVAQKTVDFLPKGFWHVNYLVNYLVTYQVGNCREVNYQDHVTAVTLLLHIKLSKIAMVPLVATCPMSLGYFVSSI